MLYLLNIKRIQDTIADTNVHDVRETLSQIDGTFDLEVDAHLTHLAGVASSGACHVPGRNNYRARAVVT
jgi:hypothetical protein